LNSVVHRKKWFCIVLSRFLKDPISVGSSARFICQGFPPLHFNALSIEDKLHREYPQNAQILGDCQKAALVETDLPLTQKNGFPQLSHKRKIH
jgi:hypothetical protein